MMHINLPKKLSFRVGSTPRDARRKFFFQKFHIWTNSQLLQKKLNQNNQNCRKQLKWGEVPP